MDRFEAGTGVGQDSVLEVREVLVDSEPEIWRLSELRASLASIRVHQVLQTAFGWEDAHLHRFVASDPFAPLRPVGGECPEVPQWFQGSSVKNRATGLRRIAPWISCSRWAQAGAFYEYDFGDSWLHRLELVSRRPADEGSPPARLTMARNNPFYRPSPTHFQTPLIKILSTGRALPFPCTLDRCQHRGIIAVANHPDSLNGMVSARFSGASSV